MSPSEELKPNTMAEPVRRRRRPAVSCTLCRRRKLRCNRELPCSNCLRSKSGNCVYDGVHHPHHAEESLNREENHRQDDSSSSLLELHPDTVGSKGSRTSTPRDAALTSTSPHSSTSAAKDAATRNDTTLSSHVNTHEVMNRLKQLEMQLTGQKATPPSQPQSSAATPAESIRLSTDKAGDAHLQYDSTLFGDFDMTVKSTTHKARLFGTSHWINIILSFRSLLDSSPALERSATMAHNLRRCKALARVIKKQRTPAWPTALSHDLPPKDLADKLVEGYLGSLETVFRVLHVPSFRREYEALWAGDGKKPDVGFLIQLKLVLTLGATVHDDLFTLRASANQWLHEAQTWFAKPDYKTRLNLQALQSHVLLVMAGEYVGNSGEAAWIASGSLLRTAMYLGLHRDPVHLPRTTPFVAEMRRRIWNTILELSLQSSLTAGQTPFIMLDEFDTAPPGNFDDEQLLAITPPSDKPPEPKPETQRSHTTIAIALRRTYAVRLAVAKHLNSIASAGTYEETLRLDGEIRAAYKAMYQALRSDEKATGGSGGGIGGRASSSPPTFATRMADFIMHRYIQALHLPFLNAAMHHTAYAFSRKVAVEMSMSIWCNAYPCSAVASSAVVSAAGPAVGGTADGQMLSRGDHLARLVTCSSGFLRTVASLSSLVVAVELNGQLEEHQSLGPAPVRRDLLAVVGEGEAWSKWCLQAGETNVKGHLVYSMVSTWIDGLLQGRSQEELSALVVARAEQESSELAAMFQETAGEGSVEESPQELDPMAMSLLPGWMDDWQFFMPSPETDPAMGVDQMNWAYSYGATPGQPMAWDSR